MVWYGRVWYGTVCYGMLWYGMAWYGTVLGEAVWHCATRYGMYCTVLYCVARRSIVRWGTAFHGAVLCHALICI